MLLEVKTDDVIREKFDFLWTDIRSSLVKKRKELGSIRRIDTSGDQLKIEEGGIYKGKVNMDVISSKNAYEGKVTLTK